MIKKLVLVFIALFAIQSYAQEGTASPYSFYGIGSLKFKGTVENRSMGGIGIYSDSIHINLQNPASYAGKNLAIYGNEGRPVKFAVAGSHSRFKLKSDSEEDKLKSSTFDYIAFSIPMGKFGLGFGLTPFSSVGYKLESFNDNNAISERFKGEGGLNKTYLSLGYYINKNFSVGIEAGYNFGSIKNNTIVFSYNGDGDLLQYQSRENNRSDLSGLSYNIGLTHKTMVTDKLELMSGFTFAPQTKIQSRNERSFNTIIYNASNGQELVVNTIDGDLEAKGLKETELTSPSRITLGTGIGQPRKWFFGVDYKLEFNKDFNNELNGPDEAFQGKNKTTWAIGGFWIPQYNSFSSYFKRIVYRAGIHIENNGLTINNTAINEFGMSFGVGLPIGSDFFSNANFGLEIGKRGTTENNLIQENFINFHLSLSLNDRWFKKRRYD